MPTPVTWLDSTPVTYTPSPQDQRPDIIQTDDGRILIAWERLYQNGYDLAGQYFDYRAGWISTFVVNIGSYGAGDQRNVELVRSNSGFTAVYEDYNGGSMSLRLIEHQSGPDANGSGETIYAFDGSNIGYGPKIIAGAGNAKLVVWMNLNAASSTYTVKALPYDPVANSYGGAPAITPLTSFGGNAMFPAGAAFANGDYLLAAAITSPFGTSIAYTVLNGANIGGAPLVAQTVAYGAGDAGEELPPVVAVLTNGRFVVAYVDQTATGWKIAYAVYDLNGLVGSGSIGAGDNHGYSSLDITALSQGGFAMVYRDDTTGELKAASVNGSGTLEGEMVFQSSPTTQQDLTVAGLDDGRFAVTWLQDGVLRMEILDSRSVPNTTLGPAGIQTGTVGADVFYGHSLAKLVDGWAGNDVITQQVSNSTYQQVTYRGGAGDDRLIVQSLVLGVSLDGGAGTDILDFSQATPATYDAPYEFNMGTGVARLTGGPFQAFTGFEGLIGSEGFDNIYGSNAADQIDGGNGGDRIEGGLGDDILIGGNGGDVIYGGGGSDYIDGGADSDWLYTGSVAGDTDVLKGSGGDDNLYGGIGAYILVGGEGADRLNGSTGTAAAEMRGGTGDDTYFVYSARDAIFEAVGEGHDRVFSAGDWTLNSEELEDLFLVTDTAYGGRMTGNALNNRIVGNDGDDILDGKGGADTMEGLGGNDTYYVERTGDVVVEQVGQGTDTVHASSNYTLAANVENGIVNTTGGRTLTGNALNNVLTGNVGNDTLNGGDGADTLMGGGGNDVLNGGTGVDTMTGGAGDDIYHVERSGDQVIELAGGGTDTVYAISNYTLAANVENGVVNTTGNRTLTGNALNNVLTGNVGADTLTGGGGNDVLDGGAGADVLVGGQGDDVYRIDSTADVVTELAGQGTDTVITTISFNLEGTNVENATLTGTLARNLIGSSGANVLTGNGAANTLVGAGGADVLTGGGGADRFDFNAVSDSAWNAYDTITDLTNSDIIDLVSIDANSTVAGNQAFVLVSAFSGQAGQLRLIYSSTSGDTYVAGDIDGDGVGDFRIRLTGDHRDYDNFVL